MIEKVTAGIDWLSCTLGRDELDYQVWRGDTLYALQKVCDEGYTLTPRKLLGYEGYSAGNCFVGENDKTGYAQFTGEKADWAYEYTVHPKAHYSRIDVQMTIKTDVMNVKEGKRCYRAAMDNNKGLPSGRRRKIWLIIGSDGGDTCYIGSQSSDQRARIYNKEVQSEELQYTRCWRYEVVFRNWLATGIARENLNSTVKREYVCMALVLEWLTKRGVSIPNVVCGTTIVLPIERTRPTEVETSIRWLREQVRPTLRRLIEAGYRASAFEAIGIDPSASQEQT